MPVEWLTEPFALGFQQRALLGGVIAGVMASVVGTWLVLRGLSFFGDAFVHGVVPGIAAAVVFDFSPLLGAAVAAAVMVAGIELVHRQTALKEDTAIGLLFVGMLGLGVVIVSRSDSFAGSLTSILFGDALGVTSSDLLTSGVLAVLVILVAVALYRPLLALSFDPQKALALGMRPQRAHVVLLALIAAAVIGSYQSVGTLLVLGLLVGPPATAALLARTVPMMMVIAVALSVVSVWLGLVLSYHLETAASATMAIVPVALFFVTLGLTRGLRGWRAARHRTAGGDAAASGDAAVAGGASVSGAIVAAKGTSADAAMAAESTATPGATATSDAPAQPGDDR